MRDYNKIVIIMDYLLDIIEQGQMFYMFKRFAIVCVIIWSLEN